VRTGDGRFVEIQGTAETEPFDRGTMDSMIEAASTGIDRLIAIQKDIIVQTLGQSIGRPLGQTLGEALGESLGRPLGQALGEKAFRAMVDPASRKKINWKEDAS
jgi:hypothetical protein